MEMNLPVCSEMGCMRESWSLSSLVGMLHALAGHLQCIAALQAEQHRWLIDLK